MYISFYWPVPQLEYETDLTFVDICGYLSFKRHVLEKIFDLIGPFL